MRTALFIMILLVACKEPVKEKEFVYVIPKPAKWTDSLNPPPPPLRRNYGQFIFIIDSTGAIFYYHLKYNQAKYNPIDYEADRYPFLHLKPENLAEIPLARITDFARLNILDSTAGIKYVQCASVNDTIRGKGLNDLIDFCRDTANHISFGIRKITQEEKVVLYYKQKHIVYDPAKIQWDNGTIRPAYKFDPSL